MDLPALNIQRGRDHGLQPYNRYRQLCGLPAVRRFSDLNDVMERDSINALQTVYRYVQYVDVVSCSLGRTATRRYRVCTYISNWCLPI